jgi:hypothetical protein
MKIKEITISATIPTAQYANMIPSIKIEVDDNDDYEAAQAIALTKIQELSTKYAEPGRELTNSSHVVLKDIFGQKINFDSPSHIYTNDKGQIYLSGSKYADRFAKEFPGDIISKKMADKSGIEQQLILDAWTAKSDVSSGFGTAIHLALENYSKYGAMSKKLDKPYHLHDHPVINKCVKEFFKGRSKEIALSEALVIDHERRLAGTIDRLLLVNKKKKVCRVQDYKTNAEIKKKLATYWHQLSFYASILQGKGWTVEGLDIFHWDGTWHNYESEVLEVAV